MTEYTIKRRRKGSRAISVIGFHTSDLEYLERAAQAEIDSGKYTSAQIVDVAKGKVYKTFRAGTK